MTVWLIRVPASTQTSAGIVNKGPRLSKSFTSICMSRTVSDIFTPFRHSSIIKAQLYKPTSWGDLQIKSPDLALIVKEDGVGETSLGCLKLGANNPRLAGSQVISAPVLDTDNR